MSSVIKAYPQFDSTPGEAEIITQTKRGSKRALDVNVSGGVVDETTLKIFFLEVTNHLNILIGEAKKTNLYLSHMVDFMVDDKDSKGGC